VFNLFSKKKKRPILLDIEGTPIGDGDLVESLRYDLGTCKVIFNEEGCDYVSNETGRKVSWLLMIDASTERQKVRLTKKDID